MNSFYFFIGDKKVILCCHLIIFKALLGILLRNTSLNLCHLVLIEIVEVFSEIVEVFSEIWTTVE